MEELDSSCFAYTYARKYPVHTKQAALNSYQEYLADRKGIPALHQAEIEANFTKAASYHEIELKPMEKEAAAPRETLVFGQEGRNAVKMDVIEAGDDLDKAIAFVLDKRASVHRNQLQEAAKYVLWAAANSDSDLNTDGLKKIARIAGVGVGDREKIVYELEKRATLNILTGKSKEAFWATVNHVKSLSDEEFYKEATLNDVCDTIEDIDHFYGNQVKYGSELDYPENVVFGQDMDDLLKEASDLAYIPSIDTTISKKALLERGALANDFFRTYYGQEGTLEGDKLIEKVASLDAQTANALISVIE